MASCKTGAQLNGNYEDKVEKVYINFSSYDDLLSIPMVGETTADRIWELRKRGEITEEMLASVPHIRMKQIQNYVD